MPTRSMLCLLALAGPALAQTDDEPKRVAVQYLSALSGASDEAGKALLLGGVTMTAQLFSIENYELVSKHPVQREEGDLGAAQQAVSGLDKAGRASLTKLLGLVQVGDDLKLTEVNQGEANRLLAPTREKAAALEARHGVLAFALRVGKDVYWHPKNPMRAVLAKAGSAGRYAIEVHRWTVRSTEGPGKTPREWPLRVLRFTSGTLDTGWKVLPASDWNAE